ncbi:MAG TPA: ATP-binding protein [Usitatibacter sp.]|nr:ATP-binding protein [Usitatibacter sp.]
MKLSLRSRGLLVFAAVGLYVACVGLLLSNERDHLLDMARRVERIHDEEAALSKSLDALSNGMLKLSALPPGPWFDDSFGEDAVLDAELLLAGLEGLQVHTRSFDAEIGQLRGHIARLRQRPSPPALAALQQMMPPLHDRLDRLDGELRTARAELWSRFYNVYDRVTLITVTTSLVGLIVFGAIVIMFFRRLAWDIGRLEQRAASIVDGYRGPALEVGRSDEVGSLMGAVNRMQLQLRQREQNLEITREQHSHREKMAALGSLAAAIAHEINNPIAAIVGLARSMATVPPSEGGASPPRLILDQAQRISNITRQVAEFARPRPPRLELLDLNGLVRTTCRFIAYDERFRSLKLQLSLDDGLPAVRAVADHVTQVLMNLLVNSADALEGVTSARIDVATACTGGEALMMVSDNGAGMDAETLARAFEESFSTKRGNTGRGLGLFICKDLLERDGARIELASTPGLGTIATVRLPLGGAPG